MESISEAASGAIGGMVSTTELYPLFTCKTKYQAEVRSQEQQKYSFDWKGVVIYQRLGTKNVQAFISQFIYFYGYRFFKSLYLEKSGAKSIGTKANLLIAAAAGCCNVIVIQPLDVASSKMQTSEFGKSKGLWATFAEGKWCEVFDDRKVFDQLKRRLLERQTSNKAEAVAAFSAFVLSAISKCVATILTHPAIGCKVMIQAADEDEVKIPEQKTISGALRAISEREGLMGFFKGLNAQILKTVLSSALHLMVKEKLTKTTWVLMLALHRYLLVP